MIGGGKWTNQNKKLNGVYINFVSPSNVNTIFIPDNPIVPDDSDDPSPGFLWLKDIDGLLLNTSDGFNLVVRK